MTFRYFFIPDPTFYMATILAGIVGCESNSHLGWILSDGSFADLTTG